MDNISALIELIVEDTADTVVANEMQRFMQLVKGKRRWIVYDDPEHPSILMMRNGLTRHKALTSFKEGDSVAVDKGRTVSRCTVTGKNNTKHVFFHRLIRVIDPSTGYFEEW